MRFERMSGLDAEQLDELEQRVGELLKKPWDQGTGRPKELTLREALIVTSGYMRNNITEQVWAEIFDVDQSTISRYITFLTPLIDQATTEFRPSAEDAAEATRGAIALVDGTLWPCWSWTGERERELWAGKYKTTGHGSLIITNLAGRVPFVSEPNGLALRRSSAWLCSAFPQVEGLASALTQGHWCPSLFPATSTTWPSWQDRNAR